MSRRMFDDDLYRIVAGWNPQLQSHFLSVYERDDPFGTAIFSTLRLQDPMVTLEQLADMLNAHGFDAPPTLLADLRMDAEQNLGDFDVHYDPETGTASIQAEFGDRADNDTADAAMRETPDEFFVANHYRLHGMLDRIREWLHRDQDRGMDL
jgi:hypothetical protein